MKNVTLLIAVLFCCFTFCYSQPGQPDLSFGNKGIVKTDLGSKKVTQTANYQLLLQADGSFYVVFEKNSQYFISKNLPDGSVDSSYGNHGYSSPLYFPPSRAILQPDGKIVVLSTVRGPSRAKADFAILRIDINGNPDSTFSNDGLVITDFNSSDDFPYSAAFDNEGRIVVMGITRKYTTSRYNLALARYNGDGSLDSSFSNDGKDSIDFGSHAYFTSIAIQNNGKVLIMGTSDTYRRPTLARFNVDGSVDSSFSGDGRQSIHVGDYNCANALAVQTDGKIVV
jgi:uncharacterized delta-60 repeat protein